MAASSINCLEASLELAGMAMTNMTSRRFLSPM